MGFMTILHGDDRIYNNIFIQHHPIKNDELTPKDDEYGHVGTSCFDIFPTYEDWIDQFNIGKEPDMMKLANGHFGHLPVWIEGNAYFNGATEYAKESSKFVNTSDKAEIEFDADTKTLKTNVYSLLKDFSDSLITSDVLGKAFEPEQRFENPDGSEIIFDEDYFGKKRDDVILPGPFAVSSDSFKLL